MEQKDIQQLQEEIRSGCAPLQLIRAEASRTIAGQEKLIDRILLAMIADGQHTLPQVIEGHTFSILTNHNGTDVVRYAAELV